MNYLFSKTEIIDMKVSERGQITIPKPLRDRFGFTKDVEIELVATKEGVLILQCGESRSQHKNKTIIIERFLNLIQQSLVVPKKRKPTKIPKAVIAKRLKNKSSHSEKKASRKKPDID